MCPQQPTLSLATMYSDTIAHTKCFNLSQTSMLYHFRFKRYFERMFPQQLTFPSNKHIPWQPKYSLATKFLYTIAYAKCFNLSEISMLHHLWFQRYLEKNVSLATNIFLRNQIILFNNISKCHINMPNLKTIG